MYFVGTDFFIGVNTSWFLKTIFFSSSFASQNIASIYCIFSLCPNCIQLHKKCIRIY